MDIHAINRRIINEAAKKALAMEDSSVPTPYVPSRDANDCKELANAIHEASVTLRDLLTKSLMAVTRQGMKREFGGSFAAFSEDILASLRAFISSLEPHFTLTEEMDVQARSAANIIIYHLWSWCRNHGNRTMDHKTKYEDGWVDITLLNYGEGDDAVLTDEAMAFLDKVLSDIQEEAEVTIERQESPDGIRFAVCELNMADL